MPDLAGLSLELPDLDSLFDADAELDTNAKPFAISTSVRNRKLVTFDARKVGSAAKCIAALPIEGESVHMIVGQMFAGFDLLPAMLALSGAQAYGRLVLTTLGFNRDNLAQLALMLDLKQIDPRTLTVLCGDFFRRADAGLWDIGKLQASERGYGWRSYRNHTKLTLAQLGRRFFVVESSANLRSCQNIEQFTLTQSRDLFDFHAGWIDEIWKDAKS